MAYPLPVHLLGILHICRHLLGCTDIVAFLFLASILIGPPSFLMLAWQRKAEVRFADKPAPKLSTGNTARNFGRGGLQQNATIICVLMRLAAASASL